MRRGSVLLLAGLLTAGAVLTGLPAGAADPLPTLPYPVGPSPPPKSTPTAAPQDRWALVVGITAYRDNVKDTIGGANDSRVLRAVRGTAWTSISGCEAGGFDEGLSSPRHLFTGSSHVTEKSFEDRGTGCIVWTGIPFDEGLRRKAGDRDGDGGVSVNEPAVVRRQRLAQPGGAAHLGSSHGQPVRRRRAGGG